MPGGQTYTNLAFGGGAPPSSRLGPDTTIATGGAYTLNDGGRAGGGTPRTLTVVALSNEPGRQSLTVAPADLRIDGAACTSDPPGGELIAIYGDAWDRLASPTFKERYPHPSHTLAWAVRGNLRCGLFVWRQGAAAVFLDAEGGRTLVFLDGQTYRHVPGAGGAAAVAAATAAAATGAAGGIHRLPCPSRCRREPLPAVAVAPSCLRRPRAGRQHFHLGADRFGVEGRGSPWYPKKKNVKTSQGTQG
eukprot:TRINITY_DN2516_c0_g2_i3.p1 TRINITY_DN2516_c0_g2~~TRINITY_DN2516_c0_g2_i3.p1  ORF type:complete len:247 (-),score=55.31 TRINITY_DN2516_c0_g2_i3:2-742(-)